MQALKIYNTKTRTTEIFKPITPNKAGIYVCGPTVYGHPHLGHARGPICFDVLRRYMEYIGYNVRYVRNITDVGHLVNDSDEGEDKLLKKARLEQLEPMEVANMYTISYNKALDKVNVKRPSIEPRASGHIIEQIAMIEKIINNGFAYAKNGSVYFDVLEYADKYPYGELSGRVLEDLQAGASVRELAGQSDKKNPNDFALWKKAEGGHIMEWPSPWGMGYPGWHIECSAMSSKYLGDTFDIHCGGMDLLFPHHESEIAQSCAANHTNPVNYWVHNNMITINGQKMAKSLNNGIMMHDFFNGEHHLLDQAYSPMTLRFFILQAHYRSTLDFSNDALKAAEKGFNRLMDAQQRLDKLKPLKGNSIDVKAWETQCFNALNDDINTPVFIALLFDMVKEINKVGEGKAEINAENLKLLTEQFTEFINILGLKTENNTDNSNEVDSLMKMLLTMRKQAKEDKNYALSDQIRDELKAIGFEIMDGKDGASYKKSP